MCNKYRVHSCTCLSLLIDQSGVLIKSFSLFLYEFLFLRPPFPLSSFYFVSFVLQDGLFGARNTLLLLLFHKLTIAMLLLLLYRVLLLPLLVFRVLVFLLTKK